MKISSEQWQQMSYSDRTGAMLQKLCEQDYAPFDDKDEALDFVTDALQSFPEYANTVIRHEHLINHVFQYRYEGEELRTHSVELDRNRTIMHNAAMANLSKLNRLYMRLDLPPFADIDTENRQEVANFIGVYTAEIYNLGINPNKDPMMQVMQRGYQEQPQQHIHNRLRELDATFGHITNPRGQNGQEFTQ